MQMAISALSTAGGSGAGQSVSTSMAGDLGKVPAEPFAHVITDAVHSMNKLEAQAQGAVDGLMTGTGVDVHEAMIAAQKANMTFELTLAVRSKAVQAYQAVMGMQF